ncbi:exonuclease domain-containing protein [Nocardioides sp. SYSU D00065]|uniref:exonuclease domain-containing protein n=1 Tax=Nocardioides sp. SYSU D00065 TaxID=2817378 RepID=UPI001B325AD0|nr:exonuclease domain-containing protein [Nocardioides sp. SYSU D00065]
MSASKWDGWDMLGFDLETTGVDVWNDRVVQAAVVRVAAGKRPATKMWLVDPGIEIPAEASDVHGITTDRARTEGGDPGQMLFELVGLLALAMGRGRPVVGMNLSYDLSLLEAECHRHGIDGLVARLGHHSKVGPVVDVLVLDKFVDPYRKGGRKLEQLCAHYGVRHTGAHDAAGDALASCRLWPRIMAKHARKFPGHTIHSLHQSQIGWRKAQADSLREYFDRKGTEHDGVCGEWPLHRACAPALVGGAR